MAIKLYSVFHIIQRSTEYTLVLELTNFLLYLRLFLSKYIFKKLLDCVDCETLTPSDEKFFQRLCLLVLRRNRYLKPESVRIVFLCIHHFIQSELNMWQITHIQLVNRLLSLLWWCSSQKLPVVPQSDHIYDWVHMGSRRKVQSCSDMFPVILIFLSWFFVFPVKILIFFILPKQEID